MTDHGLPTYLKRQQALSQEQLATARGAELLSLCQSVTADGRLAPEELEGLKQWLQEVDTADLPAVQYLRTSIERVLADGRITPGEYREVHRAVEAILPFEARKQAVAARQEAETAEAAAAADTDLACFTFMVAGVRQEGRPEVIERQARPNDVIVLARRRERRESDVAIVVKLTSGSEIGFVPEDDARLLAPLLDDGCRYEARISEVLATGRGPIPVVQARVFGKDESRNAAQLQPGVTTWELRASRGFGLRLVIGTALVVGLLATLYAVLT